MRFAFAARQHRRTMLAVGKACLPADSPRAMLRVACPLSTIGKAPDGVYRLSSTESMMRPVEANQADETKAPLRGDLP